MASENETRVLEQIKADVGRLRQLVHFALEQAEQADDANDREFWEESAAAGSRLCGLNSSLTTVFRRTPSGQPVRRLVSAWQKVTTEEPALPDLPENEREARVCPSCGKPGGPSLDFLGEDGYEKACGDSFHLRPPSQAAHELEAPEAAHRPPTNLAEKLRERAQANVKHAEDASNAEWGAIFNGIAGAHFHCANDLDRAIPPEVWGREIKRCIQLRKWAGDPGLSNERNDCERMIATYCPPEIAQQHGWEPHREESSHAD